MTSPAEGERSSEGTIKLAPSLIGAESLFAILGDRILFRGAAPDRESASVGTRSLPARQAYARGEEAIQAWNLPAADSAFALAANVDPAYAEAYLWLALVRAWSGAEAASWRYSAEQAVGPRSSLPARDQVIADALLAQAQGDLQRACPLWRRD